MIFCYRRVWAEGRARGAAPVIAKIAKDMDILTVGIVTVPFSFRRQEKKLSQAESGIEAFRASCDTVSGDIKW